MNKRHQNGFTLYELMITLLVIGVILTFGVPNFTDFTRNSQLTSTANDLHSAFQLGRSEAARSKSNITICASSNSLDVTANCSGTFADGWIVFIDLNGDIDRSGAGENLLRTRAAVHNLISLTTNGGATYFSFGPTGLGRGDVGVGPALQTAMICDDRGLQIAAGGRATARRIVATPIGRATVISDKAMIDAAGGTCPNETEHSNFIDPKSEAC
jgi:type IV fimbrial biogenesis protein FimT